MSSTPNTTIAATVRLKKARQLARTDMHAHEYIDVHSGLIKEEF